MFGFLRNRLGHKIMAAIVLTVVLVMAAEITVRLFFGTKDRIEAVTTFGGELATSTHAGIKHPMSVGDSKAIERELSDIREKMEGVEIFICDFDQEIIYSTHKDKVKSKVADSVYNKAVLQALGETLETGIKPSKPFKDEVLGRRYLITIHPILNQRECHHCHGPSRKVLGSYVLRMDIE